jgi:hypothetical protein
MNTNGKMVSCDDCIYDNKFGSWNCVGCVAKSNFVPRSKSRIYYKSVQEMNQPPAAYIAMTEALKSFGVPKIRNVIFNRPLTIVVWADGTKTFVKAVYDEFDPEKGLAMAIAKKALGNKYSYFDVIKKWVDKYLEKEDK